MDGLLRLMAEIQDAQLKHNPYLRDWEKAQPNRVSGKGDIETAGSAENIIWQTRSSVPTVAETALADALERSLEKGATTLAALAADLNAERLVAPGGSLWSAELLATELHRLGA